MLSHDGFDFLFGCVGLRCLGLLVDCVGRTVKLDLFGTGFLLLRYVQDEPELVRFPPSQSGED